MIRLFPVFAVILMLGPVSAGLAGTVLPAFGWFPALGGDSVGFEPFKTLGEQPGIAQSIFLSFSTGMLATVLSLLLAIGFVAASFGTPLMERMGRLIAPMLSIPHATLALGLAFLLAPSGWLIRAVSPWATGWVWPPDFLIINDPGGLSLVLGLVLKEAPFLFLMLLAALDRLDASRLHIVSRSLGYAPMTAWVKVILPQVYPRLRLPIFAGAGRLTTLTTEAVALSSGGDRRVIGVYGWLQMMLPLLAFAAARSIPGWVFRSARSHV
jgi:putative thiamine transport system permease protein